MRIRVLIDGSGSTAHSIKGQVFREFLTELARFSEGYGVVFDTNITAKFSLDSLDVDGLMQHVSGGGTDYRCLSAHLEGSEWKILVTDGLGHWTTGAFKEVSNLIVINPNEITEPKKKALAISLLGLSGFCFSVLVLMLADQQAVEIQDQGALGCGALPGNPFG